MGSVKDLQVIRKPSLEEPGLGRFVFSDRYSVFDWGEMPQHLDNKGRSLCVIGAYFFEKLEKMGVKTHYRGLVEDGHVKKIDSLKHPSDTMEVDLLNVIKPVLEDGAYDYSAYGSDTVNFLIPLEIIYRNWLPEGASVFKRLETGSSTLEDLGLSEMPKPGQKLERPIIDVSSKLEATDRYVSWEEARKMAVLSDREFSEIKNTINIVNDLISAEAGKINLVNNDGKMEMGFDKNRNVTLVDVIGTPDECRFTSADIPVSKEAARIFYRRTQWYEEVNLAKKKDRVNWKKHVKSVPPLLEERLALLIGYIYQAFANEVTGRKWFDVPVLSDILDEVNGILKSGK
ncbi:MAG: phosphoribosylaminoimidazolesuccinocarboxamide synthase [Elusimicrobia bacterium]|nr:phosphoribosylaminoimidazolesuccinocarboxamide synthase [Elusimicrobiota bacterium]